jgi:hypothetical protein
MKLSQLKLILFEKPLKNLKISMKFYKIVKKKSETLEIFKMKLSQSKC